MIHIYQKLAMLKKQKILGMVPLLDYLILWIEHKDR